MDRVNRRFAPVGRTGGEHFNNAEALAVDLALEGFQEIYALNLDDYNNLTIAEISNFFNIVEEIVLGEVPEGIEGEHISTYKVSEL